MQRKYSHQRKLAKCAKARQESDGYLFSKLRKLLYRSGERCCKFSSYVKKEEEDRLVIGLQTDLTGRTGKGGEKVIVLLDLFRNCTTSSAKLQSNFFFPSSTLGPSTGTSKTSKLLVFPD